MHRNGPRTPTGRAFFHREVVDENVAVSLFILELGEVLRYNAKPARVHAQHVH
ncbi:MAG: Uncharacterised protein [Rhodospirillaceae bacterium]|nr:MAG: Uncharacterised protein [Rhodospirillaceae bacterium]